MGGRSVSRLALGLGVAAVERVRQRPVGAGVYLAVGAARQSARRVRELAGAMSTPPTLMARSAGRALRVLPGSGVLLGPLGVARDRWAAVTRDARMSGAATVAAGRLEAAAFLTESVDDGVGWAQREVIPSVVDGLVPHLLAETMPRLIEGALPEIRQVVLPVVIDDLTTDPKIRALVAEQGRGMMGDAAQELRGSAASADDRVESAFQRLLRRQPPAPADPPPAGSDLPANTALPPNSEQPANSDLPPNSDLSPNSDRPAGSDPPVVSG